MKTKNIFCVFLTAIFVLGTMAMNAQTKIYVYKTDGTTDEYNIADIDSISFTAPEKVDYSPLIVNEIDGNFKFVEIYNSGAEDISMKGVTLDRNNGKSSWTGTAGDVIPAGSYRLVAFSGATTEVTSNPAYVGWTVSTGISASQGLIIALIDPDGNVINGFRRGDDTNLGQNNSVTVCTTGSYSRMSDGTWVYAEQTPGEANGTPIGEIGDGTAPDGYSVLP